jgi:hypothetical protein
MERRVTVNDRIERLELEVPEDWEPEFDAKPASAGGPQGPCLYLGPGGERCARPAIEGGYCQKHHADSSFRDSARPYARVLVASVALVILVWPYISDLVRDLIRWLSPSQ